MRFEQVQRFILAKKIFWGEGHFKPRLLERFFARTGDAIFQTLSRRQCEMKIACVATLELATRQVKKSHEKRKESQCSIRDVSRFSNLGLLWTPF